MSFGDESHSRIDPFLEFLVEAACRRPIQSRAKFPRGSTCASHGERNASETFIAGLKSQDRANTNKWLANFGAEGDASGDSAAR